MGDARRERRVMAARAVWPSCAWALAIAAMLSSCAPAPGVATHAAPPAESPPQVNTPIAARRSTISNEMLADLNRQQFVSDSLLGVWMPVLSLPRADSSGRLDWSPMARWSAPAAYARASLRDGRDTLNGFPMPPSMDSLPGWRAVAADTATALRPYALRRMGSLLFARRDTLGAVGALEELAAIPSPWGWEALRTRCDLAMAAGQPARAESLLSRARTSEWPPLDLSTLRMRQATLAQERGDTVLAVQRAREVLDVYPAMPTAGSAVALLQRIAASRGAALPLEDLRKAAESARLRGDRVATIDWLARAHAAASGPARTRIAIQWARALREARRFDAALAVIASALRPAPAAALAAELRLERARCYRAAGRGSESMRVYGAVEQDSLPNELAAAAGWEHGLELVAANRLADAREVLRRAARRNGERSDDARLLCGLLWIAEGKPQRAEEEWPGNGAESDAFTFWRATLTRQGHDAASKDVAQRALLKLASRPGYSFYSVAARETLAVRGGPGHWIVPAAAGGVAPPAPLPARRPCAVARPELQLAEALIALGDRDAAMLVLQRLRADVLATPKPRTARDTSDCRRAWLTEASGLAFGMNQMPLAIRLAQNALELAPRVESRDSEWSLQTLRYPPALDSLYGALPEPRGTDPVDRALLRAVAWQESRFDPRARSQSDALGLYQLKLATAGDMARRLGEAPPDREAMFDPATSLRYGREYLHWLLERFGNNWPVAVSAYNSGPTPVSRQWQALLDRGGAALFCELIGRAETRDYVRNIMGARAAYRELRPYALSDSAVTAPR